MTAQASGRFHYPPGNTLRWGVSRQAISMSKSATLTIQKWGNSLAVRRAVRKHTRGSEHHPRSSLRHVSS
ncbi:hypothetical protein CBM2634_P30010 [Cupriavidus taiwanensis]|uniref:Uncharacterized protein n=1 Tax=Cupriavidus taiwanensis TaxID=164546 RepID=A0A375JF95_9BURK|nr:hypothetical protein CBM2634_P30010 [Cupriavidus taiwanensis]